MTNDGMLSQEEIDALLAGKNQPAAEKESSFLTDFEKDTLGEVGNISMGTSATILSTILRRRVSITTPEVRITTREKLRSDYQKPYLVVEVEYRQGLYGTNVLIVKQEDACVIADLMMGVEPNPEHNSLSEIELSAVGEAMNQMMGSATTSLSTMFNTRIDITPPLLTIVDLGEEQLGLHSQFEEIVAIKFNMEIEGLVQSEIMQVIPIEAVKNMLNMLTSGTADPAEIQPSEPTDSLDELDAILAGEMAASAPAPTAEYSPSVPPPQNAKPAQPAYTVQPVQFSSLQESPAAAMPQNIELIMDVPLDVSVELGKTTKTIKDVLELQQGSIIQLDKMAGEPVDLIVNGKLIARGEVVVIDENYGIRITAIISPVDRVSKLQ